MWSMGVFTPIRDGDPVERRTFGSADIRVQTNTSIDGGGYTLATVQFTGNVEDGAVPAGSHCELYWDGALGFEGIRKRPTISGRYLASVELAGYAPALLNANPWYTKGLASPQELAIPMGTALLQAMAQAPLIQIGQWGFPQGQIKLSELSDRTPWQVAEQLATATGYDLLVYKDRTANWRPRLQPETPDYQVPVDDCPSYVPDDLDIFTRLVVTYTDPTTGEKVRLDPFIDWDAERDLGIEQLAVKDAGRVSRDYAMAWGEQQIKQGPVVTVRASVGPVPALADTYGNLISGPLVQSGQFLRIGEESERRGTHAIISTTVDNAGNVTVQLGARPLTPAADQAGLRKGLGRIAANTNLNSGGPS